MAHKGAAPDRTRVADGTYAVSHNRAEARNRTVVARPRVVADHTRGAGHNQVGGPLAYGGASVARRPWRALRGLVADERV